MGTAWWTAVGALGQCASATATAIAVIVALRIANRTNTPRLHIHLERRPSTNYGDAIFAFAVNEGQLPVQLTSAGMRLPNGKEIPLESDHLLFNTPVVPVGESVFAVIPARTLSKELRGQGLKGDVTLRCFFTDARNYRHYDRRDWRDISKLKHFGYWAFRVEG